VGPVVQQGVRSSRRRGSDLAGHGAHLPAEILRHLSGDQGTGAFAGLDHDRHAPERRHDPIAGREHPAPRPRPGRELPDHHPTLDDLLVEAGGSRWIRDVDPGAEDGQRQPARVQRAAVGA
jgi:hypothetical protein